MPMRAVSSGWITNDAVPGVRAHVTPVPSDDVAVAILGALQRPAAMAGESPHGGRMSAWHRAALLEAVGDGGAWEPSA